MEDGGQGGLETAGEEGAGFEPEESLGDFKEMFKVGHLVEQEGCKEAKYSGDQNSSSTNKEQVILTGSTDSDSLISDIGVSMETGGEGIARVVGGVFRGGSAMEEEGSAR